MRILLVIDNLAWGGAQRQMANLGIGLVRRGHDVDIFLYSPEHDYLSDLVRQSGVRIVAAEKRERIGLSVFAALVRHMRREHFQAAVAFMPTPATYAGLASKLAGRVPLVASDRETFAEGPLSLDRRLRRQPYRLASHVTANSYSQRERLLALFPWLHGRVSTIWNGVDTKVYRPADSPPAPAPGSGLRLLGVGTAVPVKNLESLAQALVVLAGRGGPPVTVEWAGKILDEEPSRRVVERVDALLARAGLADRWRWLGLRRDVPELLSSRDALVHPSWMEGLPNAVCEALACGTPVLASRVSDQPRLVGEGERGFLFEPDDPEEMADVIARFAGMEPSERGAMGARGRAFAEKELSFDAFVARYEELLARLIEERR